MKLTYTNVNGYLIPNLTYKSGEQMEQLGKYGFLRRDYLKNHRNSTYQVMLLQDTIGEHLQEVDKAAREREEIEAKIFASGMKKKDYFVRSCIYNRVCVVGKKETVYQIVERLQEMENRLVELAEQIDVKKPGITSEEIRDLQETYENMLKAILWMLDGARYLWQGEEKSPDSDNC